MGDLRPLDTYESGKNLKISKFDYDRYPNFDRVFTISPHCGGGYFFFLRNLGGTFQNVQI